jgi:hypothetical protein
MGWTMRPDCPQGQVVVLRPLRAMREKCLDCCCGQVAMVRDCWITGCTIWPYRHGKSPNRKGKPGKPMSDAHKRKLAEGKARALARGRDGTDEKLLPETRVFVAVGIVAPPAVRAIPRPKSPSDWKVRPPSTVSPRRPVLAKG